MDLGTAATWILAVVALVGTTYQVVAAYLLKSRPAGPAAGPREHPRVSVLKPLCGDEPGLEDNLRSFCSQTYPDYQIIFGVHEAGDAALPIARRLREEFADRDIAIAVGTGRPDSGNPKVGNLLGMMPLAKHEVLVLSDSDTHADPDCLSAIVTALDGPNVGIATCLYVGRSVGGLWSRLGAMGINHGFLPSVAVAEALGRRDGCYGAVLGLRRETLERIGGFERFQDLLAEDYYLGAAVREIGLKIAVAPSWPSCLIHEPKLGNLFAHEVRWGRTVASIERAGYTASIFTHNIFWALLALAADRAQIGVVVLVLALLGRLWAVRRGERVLGLEGGPAWMVVVRDALSMAVHVTALVGRTVRWRGQRMRIGSNGTLHTVESTDS